MQNLDQMLYQHLLDKASVLDNAYLHVHCGGRTLVNLLFTNSAGTLENWSFRMRWFSFSDNKRN